MARSGPDEEEQVARETKIGLLVGLCIILGFAWILSANLVGEGHDEDVIGRPAESHMSLGNLSRSADVVSRELESRSHFADAQEPAVADADAGSSPARPSFDGVFSGQVNEVAVLDNIGTVVRDPVTPAGPIAPSGGAREAVGDHESVPYRPAPEPVEVTNSLRQYTVKQGDSLYAIAESQYGRGRGELWKEIAKANGITDPGRIRVGMKLKLPELEPRPVAVASSDTDSTPAAAPVIAETDSATVADAGTAGGTRIHVVKQGDTLGTISQQYYSTSRKWQLIQEANGGVSPTALPIGQKLKIPALVAVADASATAGGAVGSRPAGVSGDVETSLAAVEYAVSSSSRPAPMGTRAYLVKQGETLWSISNRELGSPSRIDEIRQLNGLRSDSIRNGQTLLLPTGSGNVAMVEDGIR